MTANTDQLYAALVQSSALVPYAVTRTEEGFRVELDLYTPEVRQRAQRLAINQTFAIDVKLDASKQKAKLTDTLKEVHWGPGYTAGFQLGVSIQKGAATKTSLTFGGSDEDKARALEMKPFVVKTAKAWVRELLEAHGWKAGGFGSLFG
ncbi:MAG: hypothetical protein ACYDC9_13710 [Dermatophilaceae bacterium]